MKTKFLSLLLICAIAGIFASCSKCVTCDSCPDGVTLTDENGNDAASQEFCEEDFSSEEEYDLVIALAEEFECTCK